MYRPTYWDELKGPPLTATILGVLLMAGSDVCWPIARVPVSLYVAGYAAALLMWPTIVFAVWVWSRNRYWYARLALAATLIALVWTPILGTIVYWCSR